MKKIALLFFTAFLGLSGVAQGFELTVKIYNYPEGETIRLGRYYGNQTLYVPDTAVFDARRGVWVFRRDTPLDGGMYMLVSYQNAPAEFIIDQDQRFSIEMKYPEFGADLKFTGSPENQIFADFNTKLRPFHQNFGELRREFDALEDKTSPKGQELGEKIQGILTQIEADRLQFMQNNPTHLMTAVFRAQRDIDVPEAPDYIPENERNQWRYNYWKDNYFGNMDLTDARLLRTPIFYQRLDNYLERVLSPHHDSIKFGAERLIEQTRGNEELFRYTLTTILNKYLQSQIIGYDAIWVYLIDQYYVTGLATWTSEANLENLINHANKTRPLLIGSIPAEFWCPDLTTVDTPNERFRSVFEPRTRYTVVLFWEPSCGHCKTQMPILRDLYNEKREELDFEVFAVCRDNNVENCRNYINTNNMSHWINVSGKASNIRFDEAWDVTTSPTIYVLDWKKRIVTKRINPEQIEPFIRNWNAVHGNE